MVRFMCLLYESPSCSMAFPAKYVKNASIVFCVSLVCICIFIVINFNHLVLMEVAEKLSEHKVLASTRKGI
ncbi:unnamed protein product [Brassica rapa]|uniref:Uncharacterized protein n=2 Tax=Brassica TaxID=3705 RepID=A0A8D9H6I8_BRACM|nr:unnamed protein product [Brassica napus]CAG7893282.1 unnamed protein product [Brassica rapa]